MEPWNLGTLELLSRGRAIAGDRDSGAAELLTQLLRLLTDAVRAGGRAPLDVARVVLAGQPAMAPLWHACAAAVADADQPGTFARASAAMTRAPHAVVRAASIELGHLLTGEHAPLLLTLSYSSTVARALGALAASKRLRVVCGESRPRLEGRRLAADLSQHEIDVTVVVDAALTVFLAEASAVVMGADAVFGDRWINKVGSLGLAAAASLRGVPVYVIAGGDKFVPRQLAARIVPAALEADEIWPDRPPQIGAANIYFEAVPADLATLFLTHSGAISPPDLASAVERHSHELSLLLDRLS